MTKKLLRIFVLTAFIFAAVQSSAFAANTELLEVINDTGQTFRALYIVPSRQQDADWGDDIVGGGFMTQGESRIIYYDPAYRYYHIKLILENDEEYFLPNVDLFDAWRINIWCDNMEFKVAKNSRG